MVVRELSSCVSIGRDGKGYAGAEWWVQIVNAGPSGKLGFHLDKDESVASNKRYLVRTRSNVRRGTDWCDICARVVCVTQVHPEWSSVYYLTAAGGCTLIFDQHSPNGTILSQCTAHHRSKSAELMPRIIPRPVSTVQAMVTSRSCRRKVNWCVLKRTNM